MISSVLVISMCMYMYCAYVCVCVCVDCVCVCVCALNVCLYYSIITGVAKITGLNFIFFLKKITLYISFISTNQRN